MAPPGPGAGTPASGAYSAALFFARDPAFIFILNQVNLAFHEAANAIFGFFGEFVHYPGGVCFVAPRSQAYGHARSSRLAPVSKFKPPALTLFTQASVASRSGRWPACRTSGGGEIFSDDVCLCWPGENFLNISFYAADAVKQEPTCQLI